MMRAPEFAVVPSWQGLVIEPISDHIAMRPVPLGFTVETGGSLSSMSEPAAALTAAAVFTRRFDFPADPVPTLLRRLQAQTQDEGQAPAQSRLTLRKATVQTMLALGLGVEAQSLLRVALADDPRASADPDLNGLSGIAALLSGRPAEAGGLDAEGILGMDDVTLLAGDLYGHTERQVTRGSRGAFCNGRTGAVLPFGIEEQIVATCR